MRSKKLHSAGSWLYSDSCFFYHQFYFTLPLPKYFFNLKILSDLQYPHILTKISQRRQILACWIEKCLFGQVLLYLFIFYVVQYLWRWTSIMNLSKIYELLFFVLFLKTAWQESLTDSYIINTRVFTFFVFILFFHFYFFFSNTILFSLSFYVYFSLHIQVNSFSYIN